MADVSRAVLITGCSTGIGRATAERLAAKGHTVYATARRPETIADLEAKGCRTLALDVTEEGSMQAAVKAVEDAEDMPGGPAGAQRARTTSVCAPRPSRPRSSQSTVSARPTPCGSG